MGMDGLDQQRAAAAGLDQTYDDRPIIRQTKFAVPQF